MRLCQPDQVVALSETAAGGVVERAGRLLREIAVAVGQIVEPVVGRMPRAPGHRMGAGVSDDRGRQRRWLIS